MSQKPEEVPILSLTRVIKKLEKLKMNFEGEEGKLRKQLWLLRAVKLFVLIEVTYKDAKTVPTNDRVHTEYLKVMWDESQDF